MDCPLDPYSVGKRIALFPLPNVVLFPGAMLPLHVFEPRYQRMTAEALAGDARLVIGLLRPGWEKDYYGRPPIEPVVCVGRIVAQERLPDGKYNLLLQGQARAMVLDEISSGGPTPYRLVRLGPLPETEVMEIDLAPERDRLVRMFSQGPLAVGGLGRQFTRLLASPVPTTAIADLIAFNYLEDPLLKHSLLADGDARRRVARVIRAVNDLRAGLPANKTVAPPEHRHDPSLN